MVQISMNTVAGTIKYKNKIGVKNEQIQFNNNLIMNDYFLMVAK